MLNRLFIVVGALAILAIAAAFVVPRFIEWGDYRDRLQLIAADVLDAPVEIAGDVEFALLPQPRLRLTDVRVGDPETPSLTVRRIEAEFSLLDFLRDRYAITRLVLEAPSLAARIDEEGRIVGGLAAPGEVTSAGISVTGARVVGGTVSLQDDRSGASVTVADIDGDLRLDALRGPFGFQGSASHEGQRYTFRIGAGALDAEGRSQVSLYLTPGGDGFVLSAEGTLQTVGRPGFNGTATYRLTPPATTAEDEEFDAGRGDLVMTSTVEVSTSRILFPAYTIVPDENRAATRLTGAAEILLGANQSFNAVVSGGVLSLPPRDATQDVTTAPYEFVRLLQALPAPPVPPMAGKVSVDIVEADLRAVALRNIRVDAATDGHGWKLDTLVADLPGGARLSLSGEFTEAAGRPNFAGRASIRTERIDMLAALWRRPADGNPLFNQPGFLSADVALVGQTLSLDYGLLGIAGEQHEFSAEIGFAAATRHLNVRAELGRLDAAQSRLLLAFLPDAADGRLAVTFPRGEFDVRAQAATIAGLAGENLVVSGFWEGGVLALERLFAADLGGVGFDARLTAFGSFAAPEFSGTARLDVDSATAPALARFHDALGTPTSVRAWLGRWLPAELDLELGAPTGSGGQSLTLGGRAGAAEIRLTAELGEGVARTLSGPLSVRADLNSGDPAALTRQLGLGDVALTPESAPMRVVAVVRGDADSSFETTLRIEGGSESLGFAGNVLARDLGRLSGNGNLQVALSDLSGLGERLGFGGLWPPALSGGARLDFEGADRVQISRITATSGGEPVTGELAWSPAGDGISVTGDLQVGRFAPLDLLRLVAGPAATLDATAGVWPDGPLDVGHTPRTTVGRVSLSTPSIELGGAAMTDAAFTLAWDAESVRVRNFSASLGGGQIAGEVGLCCAGPLPLKQLSGRMSLDGVDLAALVPAPVAAAIGGTVEAAARFSGTGDSLEGMVAAMTGEGTYTITDMSVAGLDPAAFNAIETLDAVLDVEPASVSQLVVDRLDDEPFVSPSASGSFTVAGGVLRIPNLAVEAPAARLFGSLNLGLVDLRLGGGFAMTPARPAGPDGMLTDANARIVASLAGTLYEPHASFDVAGMVDTIMVEAYEMEVARLERLRAEEEERSRAAAERARIAAEEEDRSRAEEAAERRRVEEEEAARLAAERQRQEADARRQAEEAEAAAPVDLVPAPEGGFDLSLPPPGLMGPF